MHELAEVMEKLEDVKKLKCDLMDCLKAEISSKGLQCIDTKEAGEVVDMIKDLAEVEKECMEAFYYQKVTEAMVSYEEPRYDGDMMGYNPNRSKTTGRYMSGRNRSMGFMPHMPYLEYDGNMQPDDYMREAMMGYSSGNRSGNQGQNQNWSSGNQGQNQNMGYDKDMDPRYGRAYNEYRMKRRHYHETNSPTDKKEMDLHAEEHVRDIVATARDIWKDADPNLRKQMKEDFTKLVGEMTV